MFSIDSMCYMRGSDTLLYHANSISLEYRRARQQYKQGYMLNHVNMTTNRLRTLINTILIMM